MFKHSLLFLTIILFPRVALIANDSIYTLQHTDTLSISSVDSLSAASDTLLADSLLTGFMSDSLYISDSLLVDSLNADSLLAPKKKGSPIEDDITYTASDSMKISLGEKKLYLYGEAQVNYLDIELTAEYIILDLDSKEVYAQGIPDTLGKVHGKPHFVQGSQEFDSDSMRYNFETESGIIYHVITQQGEGYLHSEKTKRHPDEHIHIQDGKYTTCDAEHPHFYLALKKGIVIPEDKIITGFAYMVIADVPIQFVGIPFGFFPNSNKRSSGILIPSYGEEQTRGFYLRDMGWYQVLGDYADMRIQADWYSKGSWGIRNQLSYKYRYHFGGNFSFNYAETKDIDDLNTEVKKDYALKWTHRQDSKANPTQNFSANVNFRSSEYDNNHTYSSEQYLSNNTNSSISFTKRWPTAPFNLSLSANANQNKQKKTVQMIAPTGSFNMSSIYPLRSKSGSGKYKWYENIGLSYSSKFKNQLNTYEDVLWEETTWSDSLENGLRHDIPLSVNFKLGKLVTITPSLRYSGVMYTGHKEIDEMAVYDSLAGEYVENEHQFDEISYEQAVNPTIGMSIKPKLYGMLLSTKEDSYVEAIRHVMSPSASVSFTPDTREFNDRSYYDTIYKVNADGEYVLNDNGEREVHRTYHYYEDELSFLSPPSSNGKSGGLRLSLNNNFEMKVRPRNDTTGESKKVILLDNLNLSTSYNPFKDSLRWSTISMVAGTKLFNNRFDIRLNGKLDPYAIDPNTGKNINESYFSQTHKLGKLARLTSLSVNSGFSLKSGQGSKDKGQDEPGSDDEYDDEYDDEFYDETLDDEMNFTQGYDDDSYVDFKIPWKVNIRHSFSVTKSGINDPNITHTLKLSGDFSLTPNIKIGGQMNYDIKARETSYTNMSIYRDLHCWEMRFTVVPYGPRQSFSFTIKAKGSMLSDLKYEKKPNWYDQF